MLSPGPQLRLLDSFARAEAQLDEYRRYYQQLQALLAEHAALNTAETAREQELDLLRHQITEIESARLAASEEEEIENRYKLASNSKRLIELASAIVNRLSEADDAVLSQLAETQRLFRELEKIDSSIAQFASAHAAAVVELSELARILADYAEKLDLDPQQLEALEQRVSLFETLKRKYGRSILEVIAFGQRAAFREARAQVNVPHQRECCVGSHGGAAGLAGQLHEAFFHRFLQVGQRCGIAELTKALLRDVPQEISDVEARITFTVQVEINEVKARSLNDHLVGVEVAVNAARCRYRSRRPKAVTGT